jgi:integrase
MRGYRIDTVTGRAKLKPRREPYWSRLASGAHLGFRKLTEGEGSWIGKWRDNDGVRHYRALGFHPDYDTAAKAAREWFEECDQATPKRTAVSEACRRYVEDRRARKGELSARDAEGRFKRHIYGNPIGKVDLAKLRAADIERWLAGLLKADSKDAEAERRSKDSANRDLSALKAALNLAFRSGLIASDGAWRRVASFSNVARRRERFLTLAQRKRLYAAASPELKRLIRAIALTGSRPGEVATLTVEAFDARAGTLTLSGKTGRRTVPISPEAVAFFKGCAKSKTPAASLVARDDNSAWHRFAWRDAMQEAVKTARLPSDVVLYSIRHAAISEMLTAGIDPLSVARLAGTSVAMISKHYGHLVQDHVRQQLAAVKVL